MNTSRDRQCRGKIRHRLQRHAEAAREVMARVHGALNLLSYHCPHCNGWHVGHPSKADQKRLRFVRLLKLIERAIES